jgi:hypothetical protein
MLVEWTPEYIELKGDVDLISDALNDLLKEARILLKKKVEEGKLKDFTTHINDKKTYEGIIDKAPKSFYEAMSGIMQRVFFSKKTLGELSFISMVRRGKGISVILGSEPRYTLPMFFLVERTQASTEFGRGRAGRSIEVRATPEWLAILAAGFASSYAGIQGFGRDRDILLLHLREDLLRRMIEDSLCLRMVENEILPTLSTLNIPTVPRCAYHLYASVKTILRLKENEAFLGMLTGNPFPLEMDRIRFYGGRTFTMIEKFLLEYSDLFSRLERLEKYTLKWIENVVRSALFSGGPHVILSEKLYQAFTGSADILDVIYYANRIVKEVEIQRWSRKGNGEKVRKAYVSATKNILWALK